MAVESMYSNVRIPRVWGFSGFPLWHSSPLAEVNIARCAAEFMSLMLRKRKVPIKELEYLIIGSTILWHYEFWNAPVVSNWMGRRIPGHLVKEGCATGLQTVLAAAARIQLMRDSVVATLAFDRTSRSPVEVIPEGWDYEATIAQSTVWSNFFFDPSTHGSMTDTALAAARKYKLDPKEVNELAVFRHDQYFKDRANFLSNILVPLEILDIQGKPLGVVEEDIGVQEWNIYNLPTKRINAFVSGATQTHPSDGMAGLLVTMPEKARELCPGSNIDIQLIASAEVRTFPGLMPEAPALAVEKLLGQTGLKMSDFAVVNSHNPFAVNDLVFSRKLGYDWHNMNNNGSSLVWGHPQAPTLTRVLIEALEEAIEKGGGYVLVLGCAAGDVGIAAIFKVTDTKGGGE